MPSTNLLLPGEGESYPASLQYSVQNTSQDQGTDTGLRPRITVGGFSSRVDGGVNTTAITELNIASLVCGTGKPC